VGRSQNKRYQNWVKVKSEVMQQARNQFGTQVGSLKGTQAGEEVC